MNTESQSRSKFSRFPKIVSKFHDPVRSARQILLLVLFLFASGNSSVLGGGQIYLRSSDAPRASKTPRDIFLRPARGSEDSGIKVRLALAEKRLDQSSSKGGAGMTGRLNSFRKFVRLDIRGVTPFNQVSKIHVSYTVKEGESHFAHQDIVTITGNAANFLVDTDGFEDTSGTEVKTSYSDSPVSSTIRSTKFKHFKAEIVSVKVTVFDSSQEKLYVAAWPDEPSDLVHLPERFKPRTFTSKDGRSVEAKVTKLVGDIVTLKIRGKDYPVNLSNLSEEDQEFLKNFRNSKHDSALESSSSSPRN